MRLINRNLFPIVFIAFVHPFLLTVNFTLEGRVIRASFLISSEKAVIVQIIFVGRFGGHFRHNNLSTERLGARTKLWYVALTGGGIKTSAREF